MMDELLPARAATDCWASGCEGSIGRGTRAQVENIFKYTVTWLVGL